MRKDTNITTRDLDTLIDVVGNIYEAVCITVKRAKQINTNIREEINYKVEEFVSVQDDIKEVFENQEQIKISKYYERMAKPCKTATEELLNGELVYRYKE
ncbi:MAG: DNA-directed RNA polymerase subunit omega [Bacteroidetes bacterium]|nr:DNA-directed RNA polymerase subunit omega [Bacteroidota bacterium]